jgi:isopenicillin N synthase-like dioxygenase
VIINCENIPFSATETHVEFDADDYSRLHALVFRGDYPGYKPTVTEIPNGDGKADADKRYAHVALKYLPGWGTAVEWDLLQSCLLYAHLCAESVAEALGVPAAFRPDIRYGALRVLEYPPGAVSHEHTDFDLFTLHLYRDQPECFLRQDADMTQLPAGALALNPGLHLGELGEAIGLGKATRHSVSASSYPQHSIVYFAIPDHDAVFDRNKLRYWNGDDVTVRDWLNERMARSRTARRARENRGWQEVPGPPRRRGYDRGVRPR